MVYLHGGYGNTLPKIEAALDRRMAGYQATLDLHPDDAFGLRDTALKRSIPKSEFPPGVKVGGQLQRTRRRVDPPWRSFSELPIRQCTLVKSRPHVAAFSELPTRQCTYMKNGPISVLFLSCLFGSALHGSWVEPGDRFLSCLFGSAPGRGVSRLGR